MCQNCGSTVGPFYKVWRNERGEVVITTPPLCKNTKQNPHRISECVERRFKADEEKYKEQLHGYA